MAKPQKYTSYKYALRSGCIFVGDYASLILTIFIRLRSTSYAGQAFSSLCFTYADYFNFLFLGNENLQDALFVKRRLHFLWVD